MIVAVGVTAIVATGGLAAGSLLVAGTLVAGTVVAGAAAVAFGCSDIVEGTAGVGKKLTGDTTPAFNPIRDTVFKNNPESYYIAEAVIATAAGNGAATIAQHQAYLQSTVGNNVGTTATQQVTNNQGSSVKTDFYVTPDGEAVPATGYRYMSENASYLDELQSSMTIPSNPKGTYITFENYDVANPGALQVPHDASIKASFDTLQIIDDISIPYGDWGKASHLEPITKDFTQFGEGGATQAITHSQIIIDSIEQLQK